MKILHLDAGTMARGQCAFVHYQMMVMCGPLAENYESWMLCRETGICVVPGAIVASIEHGITSEDEIVNAVSRVSRCTRSTVHTVLLELCGTDIGRHFWTTDKYGEFRVLANTQANILLAA